MSTYISLSFPAQLMRGAGCIDALLPQLQMEAKNVFVLGGHRALQSLSSTLEQWQDSGLNVKISWFGGEACWENVDRLKDEIIAFHADAIIAVGGGKAIDTGKLVAEVCHLPLTTIPTIAATCAAVSGVSIVYDAEGNYLDIHQLKRTPERVVLDANIIARSPVRWLAAGLGDTLAKLYEIRVITGDTPRGSFNMAAYSNSKLCFDLIEQFGGDAVDLVSQQQSGVALDEVMDAIFIYAGFTSIMGSGDHAAAAHGLFEGFTVLHKTRDFGHGLLVGFGNLCLLQLEGRSEQEVIDAIKLARRCGVPVAIDEIAVLSQHELEQIADAAVATHDMSNMKEKVTRESLIAAIHYVSRLAGIHAIAA